MLRVALYSYTVPSALCCLLEADTALPSIVVRFGRGSAKWAVAEHGAQDPRMKAHVPCVHMSCEHWE
jgi:hypothetical protein